MNRINAKQYVVNYPKPFIRQYVYAMNKEGEFEKKGIMVAVLGNDMMLYPGWALCNPKDNFDKYIGAFIALQRAESAMDLMPYGILPRVPRQLFEKLSLLELFAQLEMRAKKYFKQAVVAVPEEEASEENN